MANIEKKELERILYLASASPRRRLLLEEAGFLLEVVPSNVLEEHRTGEGFAQYSLRNAQEKALHIAKTVQHKFRHDCLVVGADTIVVAAQGSKLLEKPSNSMEAKEMLLLLSDNWHEVITSFVLVSKETCEVEAFQSVSTKVLFRKLHSEEMDGYITSGEPYDKAGGYGIQGAAMGFVSRIDGSYTNVMGLPLAEVLEAVRRWELKTAK
jgi:septum formation protein